MTLILRTVNPYRGAARLYPTDCDRHESKPPATPSPSLPRFSVTSDEDTIYYQAELPAVAVDSLEILAAPGSLLISGRHDVPRQTGGEGRCSRPWTAVSFRHEYRLADNADWSQTAASHEQGVLTVAVPLQPQPAPRRIRVESSGGEPAAIEIRDGR
ncbi:MAG: Hsp20/alpha crystallin family protein [Thermoleophilia bacterium]